MTYILLQVYKQKTEVAKKEYLKALAAYRASLVSKVIYFVIFIIFQEWCALYVPLLSMI